jgi:2-acylglycerol O-acyltransferase 2
MQSFDFIFPYSYIAIWLGMFIGIGLTAACVGLFSAAFLIIILSLGMIRIMPLFTFLDKTSRRLFPDFFSSLESNIKESFKVEESNLEEGKYIFMWHPHGVFPSSIYFHTQTQITNWPKHLKTKGVVFSNLQWLPFTTEMFQESNIIPSDYYPMKKALETSSISLLPGGMREMLYEDTVILEKRRGIFKLALETGTPLVPVLSKGEAELCKAMKIPDIIQDTLKPFDACIPIPTWKTFTKIMGITQNPLKDPIYTVIGEPIQVQKIEEPSEQDIVELKQKYIEALKKMYKKEIGRDLKVI